MAKCIETKRQWRKYEENIVEISYRKRLQLNENKPRAENASERRKSRKLCSRQRNGEENENIGEAIEASIIRKQAMYRRNGGGVAAQ
jgi:hypothetical protein